jgi:hypothetical protein
MFEIDMRKVPLYACKMEFDACQMCGGGLSNALGDILYA